MTNGFQVTFDAHDPARLADFWARVLGYVRQPPPSGFDTWAAFGDHIGLPPEQWDAYAALIDPDGAGPRIFIQRVPENKTVKNRVHLDVNVGAEVTDADQRRSLIRDRSKQLVAEGASVLRGRAARLVGGDGRSGGQRVLPAMSRLGRSSTPPFLAVIRMGNRAVRPQPLPVILQSCLFAGGYSTRLGNPLMARRSRAGAR